MRDQFTFYRSFWEAIRGIRRKTDRLSVLEGIITYALEGVEPELTGAAYGYFVLIRPTLDASRRKAEGGKNHFAGRKEGGWTPDAAPVLPGCKGENEEETEKEKKTEKKKENECFSPARAGKRRERRGASGGGGADPNAWMDEYL